MAHGWIALALLASLDGTTWTAVADSDVRIGFDSGYVHGYLGCNSFSGSYSTKKDSLVLSKLATTRKGCSPDIMRQERLRLSAFGNVAKFSLEGDTLVLKAANGTELGRFLRQRS